MIAATLVAGWWHRARQHGLTQDALRDCVDRRLARSEVNEPHLFAQLASPTDGLCAGHSLFTRSDVLVALADLDHDGHGPLLVDSARLERLADGFLASHHVVQLDTSGLRGVLARYELYTTTEILGAQQRILDRYARDLDAAAAVVPDRIVNDELAAHPQLTGEQQHLVRSLCTSGRAVQCAIGRAGAGKTTTMRAAADAWRAAGYDVVGAAVKGEAARHLAAGAGIPTETVAWYLARADQPPLHERTVLVIDEASTLSDRDLDTLLEVAERSGATVRLVGDPDQHGAVAAGGMFRHLCHTHPGDTPELATTHRVHDPADRDAARLLRAGRTREALARLGDAGHLHVADSDLDLYLGMLRNWWDAHQTGSAHPMVDRRHYTRRILNRLARQLRRANGELGDIEIVAAGDRAFAVGDRIVARMVARDLHVPGAPTAYVRNGASGTVVAAHPDSDPARDVIEVCFDDVGVIALPRAFFDEHNGHGGRRDVGIDHAYAVTSYAVQGATFDVSTSRIDEGATRSEAYVDITRGRNANHLYLTRAADPLDGEHLPKAPDSDLHDTIADRLQRSGPERVAIELPLAQQPAARIRLLAHDPPQEWTTQFPNRGRDPVHLRRRVAETLRAVLAYRSRWRPPVATSSEWGWAVGAPNVEPAGGEHRAATVQVLDEYANAVAAEELARVGVADGWAIDKIRSALSVGVPIDGLAPVVRICQELTDQAAETATPVGPSGGAAPVHISTALRDLPIERWLASNPEAPRLAARPARSHTAPQRGLE